MPIDSHLIHWLLEGDNPGVRLRTLTDLCRLPLDNPQVLETRRLVIETLPAARDLSWMDMKGLALIYNLTALAESGLLREDVPVDPVVDTVLNLPFDANCGDMMALRALIMLGYGNDARVLQRLAQLGETQLADGGWMCLHRRHKMKNTPKSCYKAALHGLVLAGELVRHGRTLHGSDLLVQYFLKRRLFYRSDTPGQLVLNSRPGWRTIDIFFPSEVMRVGLPVLLNALANVGAGHASEAHDAWQLLNDKRDAHGKVCLEGTLAKPYLPKERVGKPSKWATLYACLALASRG